MMLILSQSIGDDAGRANAPADEVTESGATTCPGLLFPCAANLRLLLQLALMVVVNAFLSCAHRINEEIITRKCHCIMLRSQASGAELSSCQAHPERNEISKLFYRFSGMFAELCAELVDLPKSKLWNSMTIGGMLPVPTKQQQPCRPTSLVVGYPLWLLDPTRSWSGNQACLTNISLL